MEETSGFDISPSERDDSKYHVLRLVHESRSGFCRILEVKHSGRLFIAKTLKAEYRSSLPHLDLLKKEDEILSSLYHPSIIQSFGMVELENEGKALIMEYAHGVTLQTYLETEEMTQEKALPILKQVCSAIDYCHKRGIIHRDLKPSNIMVYPQGPIVKIIDFNFSHSPSYTDHPLPGGTKGFTAPEEFSNNPESSPASDIWSIGRLMQAMLPKGNRNWQKVIGKSLSPMPEDRPSSASLIPLMLEEKSVPWQKITIPAIITLVAGGGILFFLLNRSETPDEMQANLKTTLSSDSINSKNSNEEEFNDSILSVPVAESEDTEEVNPLNENKDVTDASELTSQPSGDNASETVGKAISHQPTDKDDLISIVKAKSEEAAAKRFKEQLAILDTATHRRTFSLAMAGHWKWKAKQDIEKWMKTLSNSPAEKKELRAISNMAIDRYGDGHYTEISSAISSAFYDRNAMSALGISIREEKYIGNGQYLVKELGEDGEVRSRIVRKE